MRTVKTDTIEVWKAKIIEQEHINKLLEDIKAEPILDKIRAEIGKSKTEHELQLSENDTKGKLLISDIYCDIVNIIDKCKAESEDKHISGKE